MMASQLESSGLPYVLSSALSLPAPFNGAKSSQTNVVHDASLEDKENNDTQQQFINESTGVSPASAQSSVRSIKVYSEGEREHVCVLRGRQVILSSRVCSSPVGADTDLAVVGSVELANDDGVPVVACWAPNGTHVLIGDTIGKLHLVTLRGKLLFSHSFTGPSSLPEVDAETTDAIGISALEMLPCTPSNMVS
jgi:hypothetical protein